MMNFFEHFNDDVIEFSCREEFFGSIPEPTPMKKHIPEWFKKIPPYLDFKDPGGFKAMSAKKCLPMLDSMSLGWVIPLQADVHVITNDDMSVFKAHNRDQCPFSTVERHSWDQVKSDKWNLRKQDPLKFINYWRIKTKPGWSCLFQTLPNVLTKDFMCLSGVVDTDKYVSEVNFPAVWLTDNADVTLTAGTPLVQVIPFKRFNNEKAKIRVETKKEQAYFKQLSLSQASRNHVYTHELREVR